MVTFGDKDANSACFIIAEIAAWATEQNKSLYQILKEIYKEFGFYKEGLISLTKKGISGTEEIQNMMHKFRNEPPTHILGSKIIEIKDYIKNLPFNGEYRNVDLVDKLQKVPGAGSRPSLPPTGTSLSFRTASTNAFSSATNASL
mgnify:CR=1 FL=1